MSADNNPDTQDPAKPQAAGVRESSGTATREHILSAAAELANEKGAAHISLEAIARRAGISKGGLLYHFPKKDALIRALVERHMADIDAMLAQIEIASGQRRTNAIAGKFVEIMREKMCQQNKAADGIFLALAENPDLLAPVRAFERSMAERIRRTASDRELSLIALLVVEGMRSLTLFQANPLTAEESTAVIDRLLALLDDNQESSEEGPTA